MTRSFHAGRPFDTADADIATQDEDDVSDHVEKWLIERGARIQQFRALVQRAKAAASPNVAMLAEIAGQARGLLGR